MREKKTKVYQLRLSEKELTELREKACNFNTVADYLKAAMAEFSTVGAKERIKLLNDIGSNYQSIRYELSKIGINLNQSVKRANELAVAGYLSEAYIKNILLPTIEDVKNRMTEICDLMHEISAVTSKFKYPRFSGKR